MLDTFETNQWTSDVKMITQMNKIASLHFLMNGLTFYLGAAGFPQYNLRYLDSSRLDYIRILREDQIFDCAH